MKLLIIISGEIYHRAFVIMRELRMMIVTAVLLLMLHCIVGKFEVYFILLIPFFSFSLNFFCLFIIDYYYHYYFIIVYRYLNVYFRCSSNTTEERSLSACRKEREGGRVECLISVSRIFIYIFIFILFISFLSVDFRQSIFIIYIYISHS